jgi:hypothetical protein
MHRAIEEAVMSTRRFGRSLGMGFILLAGLTAWHPGIASGQAAAPKLKALEQRLLLEEAQSRLDYYLARAAGKAASPGERPMLPPDAAEAGGPQGGSFPATSPWRTSSYTNVLVNNRATDTGPASGQCEVSIAAFGSNVVAAWNDGEGFAFAGSTQGYAYSTNGGLTWVDGGFPPTTNVGNWTSDPQVVVNEKTGDFYFAALCEPTASTNGVGVVKGTFSGGVLTWGTPRVVISANNTFAIYDKEWLAADSTTGNLYLIYSRYTVTGGAITTNRIDFQRNTGDNAIAWDAPITLSAPSDAGLVQGPRVAVGPTGDVWTVWNAIGLTDVDFMRVRKSPAGGTSFAAQVTAASEFTNYGSGAPGFNRGLGFAFPALAVDRTNGPHRGRAYLAWNESLNFFNDNLGTTGTIPEVEPNNVPGNATPFTMGKHLTGNISPASDFDYFQFNGVAGQTIICQVDASSAPSLDASFRLFCSDGSTRLAFSETGFGGSGLIVFTLPSNGTYTLRVASLDGTGTGAYVIDTALNGPVVERARDHRDLFVSFSDNNTTWSAPSRVNDDPGTFDNWLPEIAVADVGRPYVIWYDWRDAPAGACGGVSHVYLSRSDDGGSSWISMGAITDVQTAWTSVASNIAPNQGDYLGLFGDAIELHAGWADGRNGDPDVYTATVPLVAVPVQISVAATDVEPGRVRVTWYTAEAGALVATVYRRTGADEWDDLGRISPDGSGEIVFEDRSVQPGTRYHYRLGVFEGTRESFLGEVTVDVPVAPALAIEAVRPNPADRELWVTFSLPQSASATLELLDVSGRRIRGQTVSGVGRQTVDLAAGGRLAPGVYLVRLIQAGRSVVMRASIVR